MSDMSQVIIAKSDQLNSDDLISGPRTIKITGVEIRPMTEQPVSIRYEGDDGKPWKTCKSMNRILVSAWGPDAKAYVGRSVTLYRDPTVKWGGMEVGGIRISHMSHIDEAMTVALTMTKANRKPFTVRPLKVEATATTTKPKLTAEDWANAQMKALPAIESESDFYDWLQRTGPAMTKLKETNADTWSILNDLVLATRNRVIGDAE